MFRLLCLLLALLLVNAQTFTTTDANGDTIVEVTTTDVNGAPSTSTLSLIAPSTASSSTTTVAPVTQPTIQQGPVGQPAPTTGTPGAPIPYVYTTVINGVTTAIQDIFTPTSPQTVSVSVTGTGTILDFSAYQSIYGTASSSSAHLKPPLCAAAVALVSLVYTIL